MCRTMVEACQLYLYPAEQRNNPEVSLHLRCREIPKSQLLFAVI